MAEIVQRDGSRVFDGSTVRMTPGPHREGVLTDEEFTSAEATVLRGFWHRQLNRSGSLRLMSCHSGW
ncbi:hypothetical protein [Streptomyces avermitilis]|uniref:hypothetical protein n=1 Tax=Streptomyces avermitilis TaxID=33903 RepID=UPI00371A8333